MALSDFLKSKWLWGTAGVAAASAAGVYVYASRVEARNYKLEKVRAITCGDWRPQDSQGSGETLRILHLSDLHLAEPESHKIDFLQKITQDEYDFVFFTGDIFENESGIQYADKLIARQPKYGAHAVLGNHDYYDYKWFNKIYGRLNRSYRHPAELRDVTPFVDALTAGGINVMRNEAEYIAEKNVYLIGIDYPGIEADELQGLMGAAPADALTLAILHLPRRLHQLKDAGIHLAFAGHTHGGQVRIPGFGALFTDSELPRQEASGLVRRGDTWIHVSRGLGADPKTNFRLFCPPTANIIEVKSLPLHPDLDSEPDDSAVINSPHSVKQ